MTPLFSKLNLKDQSSIVVLNSPDSFESELKALKDIAIIRDSKKIATIDFALAFASQKADLDKLAALLTKKAGTDAVLWFAYPKGTSKKYQCDFNRDDGWDVLTAAGYDSVRMVAIDTDWSALRFRKTEFIKRR